MIQSGTNSPRKAISLILISGLALGVAFSVPFFVFDVSDYMSRIEPFRQVTLSMSQEDAINVLQKNRVTGAIPENLQSVSSKIEFSDFWREYAIYFHPITRQVVRKTLVFRDYDSPIKRFLNREK